LETEKRSWSWVLAMLEALNQMAFDIEIKIKAGSGNAVASAAGAVYGINVLLGNPP
jgi:homoserine kinase